MSYKQNILVMSFPPEPHHDNKNKLSLNEILSGEIKPVQFQEDEKLMKENYFLRKVVKDIRNKTESGEIEFSGDGTELTGNLEFSDDE